MTDHALERIRERLPGADPRSTLAALAALPGDPAREPYAVDVTGRRLWHYLAHDGRAIFAVEAEGAIVTVLSPGMTVEGPQGRIYLDHDGRLRTAGPGVYPDWKGDHYHGDPCARPSLSASLAWALHTATPRHAWAESSRLNPNHAPKERTDFDVGSAVHEILTGKGAGIAEVEVERWSTKASQETRDAHRAAGRTPLTSPQMRKVEAVVAAARLQLKASRVGDPFTDPAGESEVAIVWEADGVLRRLMADRLIVKDRVAYDLKSTGGSADPDAWVENAMRTTGIDLRVAHYLDGLEAAYGEPFEYRIVPIEVDQPNAMSILRLSESALYYGRRKIRDARARWRRCVEENRWPGYPAGIVEVTPRAYHESKQLEREEREGANRISSDMARKSLDWQAPPPGSRSPGMSIRFIDPAEDKRPLPISLGISGASGTGKTRSALEVARGIAHELAGPKEARIAFADTENRRGLHFAELFPEMVHHDFQTGPLGFVVDRWIAIIDAAEKSGIPVLIFDSFTHAWSGVGGVLDRQAIELQRLTGGQASREKAMSQLSWAAVKPDYRRLTSRVVAANLHVILCTRAKSVIQQKVNGELVNVNPTKARLRSVPWDVDADKELLFEMTAQLILEPGRPGCPVHHVKMPDQLAAFFEPDRPMTVETGRQLALWSQRIGTSGDNRRIVEGARNAAHAGREAFTAYWQGLDRERRAVLKASGSTFAECQRIILEAEARPDLDDGDPMARLELSEAERDRIAREVQAATEADERAEQGDQG